ncbi:MAG: helix-turn-helix domain-containing protein [Dehalococcoidia bacterium]
MRVSESSYSLFNASLGSHRQCDPSLQKSPCWPNYPFGFAQGRLFYYWKGRFDEQGYAGLEAFDSRAPKEPHRTAPDVEQRVISLRREHPKWGKRRISDELAKANDWVPIVSPNTVKRILKDAGLWDKVETEAKKTVSRTAEEPGQSVNVDLCFVPATHEVSDKLPAVSGSSGRLIVGGSKEDTSEADFPGRVFEQPELSYQEAMLKFVASSQAKPAESEKEQDNQASLKAAKRELRREEAQLRDERRQIRERRKLEDGAWRESRAARKAENQGSEALPKEQRRQDRAANQARDEQWRAMRKQRRSTLEERKGEDEVWRQQRLNLRERLSELPIVTAWIAILVIIDNCTRMCLGLPVFVTGAKGVCKNKVYIMVVPPVSAATACSSSLDVSRVVEFSRPSSVCLRP